MADKITFSWTKPPTGMPRSWRPMRLVKRNGVEVARVSRAASREWYWYLTALHRGNLPPKNTLTEGVVFTGQADAEADVKTWLREHPAVGVVPKEGA